MLNNARTLPQIGRTILLPLKTQPHLTLPAHTRLHRRIIKLIMRFYPRRRRAHAQRKLERRQRLGVGDVAIVVEEVDEEVEELLWRVRLREVA